MTEEVRLLEKLGCKPDYEKMDDEWRKTMVDQTTSGELTPKAIDEAISRVGKPASLIIPPRHQSNLRRDELFVEYEEEKVLNGVIGRYMGAIVIVDQDLHNLGKGTTIRAIIPSQSEEFYSEILLAGRR